MKNISQSNLTPDYSCCQYPVDPVIPELIKLYHRRGEVRISEDRFFDAFCFGSYDVDGSGRYSAMVEGVEFFCMEEAGHVEM